MISRVYLLTPIKDRVHNFKEFYKKFTSEENTLISYEVLDYEIYEEGKAKVNLSYKYEIVNENEEIEEYIENSGDTWETIKEKGVWKVRRNIENNVESEEERGCRKIRKFSS
jgi:hypothetical protein